MPYKNINIENIGTVKIYKRRGVRSIRLSIVGDGSVRVTQPKWLPYKAGIEFAQSRKQWISKNQKPREELINNQRVGKSYKLAFGRGQGLTAPKTRVQNGYVTVTLPPRMYPGDHLSQQAATKAVERALKKDAEKLLVPRAKLLATRHGFQFKSVRVKKLKSRWGSCSQNKDIVLSSYLIQLPWHLIDYVILHELQHTTMLAHGKDFWLSLERHVEGLADIRKDMKKFQARVI
ncbi:MAG: YgjP-like metallopeptidase domain-containing protein [Candidatus Saccharibacteria bacterium]|nr:YgjP-like metallopeptidase domain-containing protein [Candidatus Saccharibacteria bacterium]